MNPGNGIAEVDTGETGLLPDGNNECWIYGIFLGIWFSFWNQRTEDADSERMWVNHGCDSERNTLLGASSSGLIVQQTGYEGLLSTNPSLETLLMSCKRVYRRKSLMYVSHPRLSSVVYRRLKP